MDFNSRCKKVGYSYTAPIITTPMPTLLEMKREAADDIFRSRNRVKSHDCRDEKLVDFRDKDIWEAWLLSHGVRQSANDVKSLYTTKAEEDLKNQQGYQMDRPPSVEKLRLTIGKRGSGKGQFEFPRGLSVDEENDIYVADTKNHRIQVFNTGGVFKRQHGGKGTGDGEFDCPVDVAVLRNDDVAVADQKNKRVQIFDPKFQFKFQFPLEGEPVAMVCDKNFHIIVATSSYTIEVYERKGDRIHKFNLPKPAGSKKSSRGIVYIAINNKEEVVVSDPASSSVTFYKYDGAPLYRFSPQAASNGLGFVPAGIAVDSKGQLVIADALNHVVNVYTERGVLKEHHAGPTDAVGAVGAITLDTEGNLVAIECTNNGPHCVKLFRYQEPDNNVWEDMEAFF